MVRNSKQSGALHTLLVSNITLSTPTNFKHSLYTQLTLPTPYTLHPIPTPHIPITKSPPYRYSVKVTHSGKVHKNYIKSSNGAVYTLIVQTNKLKLSEVYTVAICRPCSSLSLCRGFGSYIYIYLLTLDYLLFTPG